MSAAAGASSKLDTEKFRKVHGLMMGGATPGERSAAKSRAESMARKAGMSLDDALSSLDGRAPQPNVFDFGEWMEDREPGWKAERASQMASRRADVMARHGSEEKLFAWTERETKLEAAVAPLVTAWGYWIDDNNKRHRYVKAIDGVAFDSAWIHEKTTPRIDEAIRRAYAWPATLTDALIEVKEWDQLWIDRSLFCPGEWSHGIGVECRIEALKHDLKRGRPAVSWEDVQARFDWKRYEFRSQWTTPQELNDPFLDRLEADIAAMREAQFGLPEVGERKPPASRHRTTADKRAAVLSMLDSHPELSDREIARRLGVSPQTVNTWRKKRGS